MSVDVTHLLETIRAATSFAEAGLSLLRWLLNLVTDEVAASKFGASTIM